MAKKNTSTADRIRKALSTSVKRSVTQRQKNAAKKRAAQKRQTDQDFVNRWKALRRYGAYNSKESPTIKNLTPRRRREISRAYNDLQNLTAYDRGRVIRPLEKVNYKTPTGKERTKYELRKDWFNFQRIKGRRPTEAKAGVHKTKKGFIVRRAMKGERAFIDTKGNVVRNAQGFTERTRGLTQTDVLEFMRLLKEKKIKLKRGEWMIFRPYGRYTAETQWDDPNDLLEYLNQYMSGMPQNQLKDFEHYSEVSVGRLRRSS